MRMTRYAITILCLSLLCAATAGAVTEDEYQEQIRALEQRNAQLENSLEAVTAELRQADVTLTMLKKQIMDMTGEAEKHAQDMTETRNAMKQVKDQLTALLAQQAEVDVAALQQQLAAAVQRAQKLEEDSKLAQAKIAEQDKTLERLQREQDAGDAQQLRQQIGTLRTESEQQREQLKTTVGMLQDREAEVETAQATIRQLQEQVRSASTDARVEELEAVLAEVNAKLITIANEKNRLETQVQGASQSQQQSELKDAEIARLEGELRKAAEYINSRAADIASLTAAKTELETQLLDIAASKTGIESRLTKSLEERTLRIQQLERELQDARARLESTEAKLREVDQITQERDTAIKKLEADLQYQSSVPEAAKERIAELTLELQDVKSQFDLQETMKREYPILQQDLAACKATMSELAQEQDRCQTTQKELQEQVFGLEQTRDRLDMTLREKLAELDEIGTQRRGAEADVDTKVAQRETAAQTCREFEAQYAENQQQLKLKEQVLQQALTDKALLEKQLETHARLQEEVLTLRQSQAQRLETQQGATSAQAMLQEQVQQEQARRRQLEAELLALQKQLNTLPSTPKASAIQPVPAAANPSASQGTALRMLFPQEIIRSMPGSTVAILSASTQKTKIAYQETAGQTERLWMLDTRTRQVTRLLEWQRAANVAGLMSRLAWADDEEHFLFSTGTPGGYGLYLGNSSGMIAKPVLIGDAAPHFAWAPQQLRFAYFSGANLMVQEVSGGTLPLQLGNTSGGAAGTSLQWSPDGRMLAFSVKRGSNFDIFTVTLSGNQPTIQTVVASPSDDIQPAWSPDGRHLAFYVRSSQYDTKLAIVPVDQSRAPLIIAHQVVVPSFAGPQWTSSTNLVYLGAGSASDAEQAVYTVDIATGKHTSAPLALVLEY